MRLLLWVQDFHSSGAGLTGACRVFHDHNKHVVIRHLHRRVEAADALSDGVLLVVLAGESETLRVVRPAVANTYLACPITTTRTVTTPSSIYTRPISSRRHGYRSVAPRVRGVRVKLSWDKGGAPHFADCETLLDTTFEFVLF